MATGRVGQCCRCLATPRLLAHGSSADSHRRRCTCRAGDLHARDGRARHDGSDRRLRLSGSIRRQRRRDPDWLHFVELLIPCSVVYVPLLYLLHVSLALSRLDFFGRFCASSVTSLTHVTLHSLCSASSFWSSRSCPPSAFCRMFRGTIASYPCARSVFTTRHLPPYTLLRSDTAAPKPRRVISFSLHLLCPRH